MKLSKSFLQELQKRLKIGDRRSVHLNALIKKSNYKLDFSMLSFINDELPQKFLDTLLSESEFNFEISWQNRNIDLFNLDEKEVKKLERIENVFTKLQNQIQTIREERGIETFGFGYPLFIKRGRDRRLIVAPLIVWKLELKRSRRNNTWNIIKTQDSPIYLNEVLINYLKSDSEIILSPLDDNILDDGVIERKELKEICKEIINKTNIGNVANLDERLDEVFSNISEIKTEDYYESFPLNETNSLIENAGLFSYFEIQKHSIIQDYEELMQLEGLEINQEELGFSNFQSLTSIQTDPSQQQLLNNINKFRNLIIQGPPGTGKSQTLTAILTNALENDKKCLVVCEKHTALQVLKEGLEKAGLDSHIAIIQDATKDRRNIVSSVRDKIEYWEGFNFTSVRHSYPSIVSNYRNLISLINDKHKELAKKLLAEYNWTDIVGKYLKNLRLNNNYNFSLRNAPNFNYNYEEYEEWRRLLEEGNKLYLDYKLIGENNFIPNEKFLEEENFYAFEDSFNQAFDGYKDILDEIQLIEKKIIEEYKVKRYRSVKSQTKNIEKAKLELSNHKIDFISLIDEEKEKFISREVDDIMGFKNLIISKKDEYTKRELCKLNEFSESIKNRIAKYVKNKKFDFEKEFSQYRNILISIEKLLSDHENNEDFTSEEKTQSTLYHILSWFSSNKSKTIRDVKEFDKLYNELVSITKKFKFFSIQQRSDRAKKISEFKTFNQNLYNFDIQKDAKIKFIKNVLPEISQQENITSIVKYIYKSDISNRKITIEILEDFVNSGCSFEQQKVLKIAENNFYAHRLASISNHYNINTIIDYIKEGGISRRSLKKERIEDFVNFENPETHIKRVAERKFSELNLNNIFYTNPNDNFNSIIGNIREKKEQAINININQSYVFDNICNNIDIFSIQQKKLWESLRREFQNAEDFDFIPQYPTNYVDNTSFIKEINENLISISDRTNEIVDNELLNLDIIRNADVFENLDSFQEITRKINDLHKLIKHQNFVKDLQPLNNYKDFVENVQNIVQTKKDVFDESPTVLRNVYNWGYFYEQLNRVQKNIIDEIRSEEKWEYAFFTHYFNRLLRQNANDILPTDDDYIRVLEENQEELKGAQTKYINYIWFSKQYESVDAFNRVHNNFQVKNLYNLKGGTRRRKNSLKNIIEFDCDLFTDLYPIILTTPDAASNLFRNQNKYFDFVIFDEASQLRLEDNLPAMLKGKHIIIAGDEHQMPPSNFFSRLVAGEIDNEDDIEEYDNSIDRDNASQEELLLSAISLLDAARELNFENKDLTFHYRSKHPYLIDFSNYAFYNQKLIPMPITSHYNPIKYVNVNGVYDDNINEKEAEIVLSILEHNIHRNQSGEYPSVGVATFNVKQRDLIKKKIIERQNLGQYKEFNRKITELEEKGLFIKNLENIQGDERDVIIISTTYGRATNGSFYQRFGSLNQQKGYKLLNVIVTRAKYKNYIVTSIPEENILDYNSHLTTQQTNYGKAPLYAYLAYAKAVSEGNEEQRLAILHNLAKNNANVTNIERNTNLLESVFEEEVYERLSQTNLKDYIELQYKVGGFRIDMVIDFKLPNIPKIAIECDGAKYHSSNEAYLYDYHRQKILESHGFKFHRIWGTNWWRNPEYEMKQLLNFIEEIRQREDLSKNIEQIDAFSDEFHYEENGENVHIEELNEIENIEAISRDENIIIEEEQREKVKLNSKLVIEYTETEETHNIRISTQNDITTSPKIIDFRSPLGKALIGKSIGDIIQIEGVGKHVKILDIENG